MRYYDDTRTTFQSPIPSPQPLLIPEEVGPQRTLYGQAEFFLSEIHHKLQDRILEGHKYEAFSAPSVIDCDMIPPVNIEILIPGSKG